jgi:hypothetical protein
MIKLIYNPGCRLGNRLYMYAAGRLLARKLGIALQSDPLEGFPRTRDVIIGRKDATIHIDLNGADPIPTWPKTGLTWDECQEHVGIEIKHGFVNSRYFINDRDLIKTWFGGEPLMQVDPDDVLVNIRLKEFTPLGLTLDPIYYMSVLERMSFKKLYLMTDDPGNPYLDIFKKYNPIPVTGFGVEHFFKALGFKRIVMSNSTFCWWFTFVSEATEIYFPMINGNRCGSWCLGHLPSIDLRWDWPEVTTVYNVPNWGSPLADPTDAEQAEALVFGKKSKTLFL